MIYSIVVGKCSIISKGNVSEYQCPNDALGSGKCLLHAGIEDDLDNALTIRFDREFNTILDLDTRESVFQGIKFPRSYHLKFPKEVPKPVIFRESQFLRRNSIGGDITFHSLEFDHCGFSGEVAFFGFRVNNVFRFVEVGFDQLAEFKHITGGFRFELRGHNANTMVFANIDFEKGLIIDIDSYAGDFSITNAAFNGDSLINISRGPSHTKFEKCKFLCRTELTCNYHASNGARLEIKECGIDNLFLKNIRYDNEQYRIDNPRLIQKPRHVQRKFKSFYRPPSSEGKSRWGRLKQWCSGVLKPSMVQRDPEFDFFIDFIRMSKDYFSRSSEHLELYQLYYRLDQFFSRLRPSYTWQRRIVNNIYRWFSDYGYSLWRPLIFLCCILVIFNLFFFAIDTASNRFGTQSCIYAFLSSFGHHLEQISFFRTPDDWFQAGSLKRFLLLIESVILIPTISFFIIGIRKTFKRG